MIWHFIGSCGAWAQTAYRLPALSMASVGKLAPVFAVGQVPPAGIVPSVATGKSLQLSPLGSLVKGTGKQRPIRILLNVASSWMTKTCLTGAGAPSFVVAIGLTSLFPMIPSSQLSAAETFLAGPNWMPAAAPAAGSGDRYIASTLLTNPDTGQVTAPGPISSLTRKML